MVFLTSSRGGQGGQIFLGVYLWVYYAVPENLFITPHYPYLKLRFFTRNHPTYFANIDTSDSLHPSHIQTQHELIHHLPQFARRWRTVGYFREEGMEAKHHEVNGINRVLACMRKEEDRLANCLRRVEVRQTQKAGDLAHPVPRNFNVQRKQKA